MTVLMPLEKKHENVHPFCHNCGKWWVRKVVALSDPDMLRKHHIYLSCWCLCWSMTLTGLTSLVLMSRSVKHFHLNILIWKKKCTKGKSRP